MKMSTSLPAADPVKTREFPYLARHKNNSTAGDDYFIITGTSVNVGQLLGVNLKTGEINRIVISDDLITLKTGVKVILEQE